MKIIMSITKEIIMEFILEICHQIHYENQHGSHHKIVMFQML